MVVVVIVVWVAFDSVRKGSEAPLIVE